ncbi:GNAT family N-acetyltransferase [Halobacillus rhizosphaerae]|uniref:GNAT family N-acetyltransferase n=1 Tax=Halobacillus rhizosphaerae TaxID=3064889 RepID=UPI00398B78FB
MKVLTFDTGYSHVDVQRERLYPLFEEVFGIPAAEFRRFYDQGFWDHTYQPFTYLVDNLAISNVSCFDMPLIMEGKIYQSAGIQSFMTHPEYRDQGLMKSLFKLLLEHIDERYERSFLYTSNPELYTPYGFQTVTQHYFKTRYLHKPAQPLPLKKLDLAKDEDAKLVYRLLKENEPSSHQMTALTYRSAFYLNLMNSELASHLYYSSDLDILILFHVIEDCLEIYDCAGAHMPDLAQICDLIPVPFQEVHVFFTPDRLNHPFEPEVFHRGSDLMVRGKFLKPLKPFMLPITAEF